MAVDSYARQLAQIAMNKGGSGGTGNETDPTVPEYVKKITEEEIAKWNEVAGSSNFIDINDTDYPESNPFDLETLKPGMWIYAPDYQTSGYVKAISPSNKEYRQCKLNNTGYEYAYLYLGILAMGSSKYVTFLRFEPTSVTAGSFNDPSSVRMELFRIFISNNIDPSTDNADFYLVKNAMSSSNNASITGQHTYNVLPTSTVVPTADNQFVNKKYVDDSISTAITGALGGSY